MLQVMSLLQRDITADTSRYPAEMANYENQAKAISSAGTDQQKKTLWSIMH